MHCTKPGAKPVWKEKRMIEEEASKPRKKARLAYDWRTLMGESISRTEKDEPVRTDSEGEETDDNRTINPEKNLDDILSILEEEEEKLKNQDPEPNN